MEFIYRKNILSRKRSVRFRIRIKQPSDLFGGLINALNSRIKIKIRDKNIIFIILPVG